jgi:hypothetical protein
VRPGPPSGLIGNVSIGLHRAPWVCWPELDSIDPLPHGATTKEQGHYQKPTKIELQKLLGTEQGDEAVTILTCILEIFVSNIVS